MPTCSKCGKSQGSGGSGSVVLGRPAAFRDMVGKCSSCGRLVCGACAKPDFKLYASARQAQAAGVFAATEYAKGRELGWIMDEVYRRFDGAELSVRFLCPYCEGNIGPA